jgi:hypothetical protein
MKLSFRELIKNYNSMPITKLMGILQLCPFNHGKNVRLEQMARLSLLEIQKGKEDKPNAYWDLLKAAIENYTEDIDLEEDPTTAFTENVVFAEGNYTIYPGVYVSGTRILNELLECIFLTKNEFPEQYKKLVNDGAGLLLFMSNIIARDMKHDRNIYEESSAPNIQFPEYDQALEYMGNISFSKEYVKKICRLHHYEESIVNEFLIHLDDPDLSNDDPDNNIVNRKPLIEAEDELEVYMPTSIVPAVTDFIYRKGKEYNCYEELQQLFQKRQFEKTCEALVNMNWIDRNIKLPESPLNLPVQEAIFQFDNQKVGYLCFIGRKTNTQKPITIDAFAKRNEQVVNYLSTLSSKQSFQVLSLFVLSETGADYMFACPKPADTHLCLSISYSELDAITYSDNTNSHTLWKFAKTFSRTSKLLLIDAPGGTLDAFVAYDSNHGSFLDSDEANPIGGNLYIPVGYSNDFLRKIQIKRDEHAAIIFYNRQRGYTKVIRYKDYAPIYIEKEPLVQDHNKVFRLLVESYKMPIWITNIHPSQKDNETWSKILCEGVAFWLIKMQAELKEILATVTLIQFEIEIITASNLNTNLLFKETDPDIEKITIDIKIEAPRIQITIPFDFMFLVRRPDNYADKALMKAILNGIVLYVKEAKGTILLDTALINNIIEQVLQPATAKMFLFSDVSENFRLDNRTLASIRYIHESDISFILDNLIGYLPAGYKVPEFLITKDDKRNLCNTIVTSLIKQIQIKLEEFDGEQMLEWLIKMNEKYVQIKEYREILVAPKIASFSTFQDEVDQLHKQGQKLISASQAIRTLIEFVAANLPKGSRWPNYDEVEELLALIDQLISWGSESDAIWKNMSDPQIGLLPSGRIGTEKKLQREIFVPFAIARATSEIFQQVERFEKTYTSNKPADKPATVTAERDELDIAFKAEFGISLKLLSQIILVLAEEGFEKNTACVIIEEKEIYQLLCDRITGISDTEIETCLNLLSLAQRDDIGKPPNGYKKEEIYPWRQKRSLSYLRRPLAKVKNTKENYYYFGFRHLIAYLDNLHYLLYEGKLPNPASAELKRWLGTVSSGKGNSFREKVMEWFQKETDFQVIPKEVDISKKGQLKADRDYGDIDVLVIDHKKKIIYSIECKNITGGKTIYEMWSEICAYLGEEDSDDAKIIKHLNRHKWLNNNKESLAIFVSNYTEYEIKSFVLTADEIPLAFIKKHQLPLPVKSFVFLRKSGIPLLDDI